MSVSKEVSPAALDIELTTNPIADAAAASSLSVDGPSSQSQADVATLAQPHGPSSVKAGDGASASSGQATVVEVTVAETGPGGRAKPQHGVDNGPMSPPSCGIGLVLVDGPNGPIISSLIPLGAAALSKADVLPNGTSPV
jgi:hypothetical protein